MVNSDELVPARQAIFSGLFWAVISWSIPWCDIITCSTRLAQLDPVSLLRTRFAVIVLGQMSVSAPHFPLLFPRSCPSSLGQRMVSTPGSKSIRSEKLLGRPAAGSPNQFPIISCATSDNRLTDSRTMRAKQPE
ncbi:hypothetical protein BJX68DRAFT_147103 [Aspergillus pseudodeflectus]|uniref:Uncharacterized protein n=1 Tax=Aspergillus pseudodeflectus TaxID=176178 RepID=A0ABR4JX64_9EURO